MTRPRPTSTMRYQTTSDPVLTTTRCKSLGEAVSISFFVTWTPQRLWNVMYRYLREALESSTNCGKSSVKAAAEAYSCTSTCFSQDYRITTMSKYFKEKNKINKNVKTSIQSHEQISEISLPKTSKFLFCSICLLYDCNQHNIDANAEQFNYTYVASQNIVPEQKHVKCIVELIRFWKDVKMQTSKPEQMEEESKKDEKILNLPSLELEQGQDDDGKFQCSDCCYRFLTRDSYKKKSLQRRPIISLIHRALIKLAIDIFSYDPCMIFYWASAEISKPNPGKQPLRNSVSCQNIFFYLMEEYNLPAKLYHGLYDSQVDALANEPSCSQQVDIMNSKQINNRGKKKNLRFDHQNAQNYKVGCCFHYFIGKQVIDHQCQKCSCKERGFCLPQCQCPPTCKIKKVGCKCRGKDQCRKDKCQCFQRGEECYPGLCEGCFDTQGVHNKKNNCRNSMIMRNQVKHIKIGASNIEGLGAFAMEDIAKDQLVVVYTGEIILHQIDYIRQGLRFDNTFYNFNFNEGGAIDARYLGNKSRFINHQNEGQDNCHAVQMFSQGKWKTVLYAKKDIKKGEELFFNYDTEGQICKNFPGKYPFIKKSKKKAGKK